MSEVVYPVEHSLRGDNTVYVPCEFRARQQNYAICLNVIKGYDEKRRKEDDICCSEIKKKICPALKMREEELAAGHTLYYVPRIKVTVAPIDENRAYVTPEYLKCTDSYQRGYSHAGNVIHGKTETVVKIKRPIVVASVVKKAEFDNGDMASIVSQMAREHVAKAVEVKEVVDVVKTESVLERARRIRESRGL